MRNFKITVTDDKGKIIDTKDCEVRDGVKELYVQEIIPGTRCIERCVAQMEIGAQDTVWINWWDGGK